MVEDPVFGESFGMTEALVDVSVEAVHAPHRLLLDVGVDGILFLHVLRSVG